MSLLRRRRLPPELAVADQRFGAVLAHVERAKEAATTAVPVARVAPAPMAEALFAFEGEMRAAKEGMPSWRVPEVEVEWAACDAGIDESLARAASLRTAPPDMTFGSLVETIGDLIAPLESFAAAVDRFRGLRR